MEYFKSYKGTGRFLRYFKFLSEQPEPTLIQETLQYCEETKNIGSFNKLKEITSSVLTLDDPEWRKNESKQYFEENKKLEEQHRTALGDDEKAKMLYKLSDFSEKYGEYQRAIKYCNEAIENLKNKILICEGCFRLIKLNIFQDNFHQASLSLEKLKLNDLKNDYIKFITFIEFLFAIRSPDTFRVAFNLFEKIITFDDKENWIYSEFLSFEDIAIYVTLIGLLTQPYKICATKLINNPKFRNHANTIPELVVLLNDYKQNKFSLISNDVKQLSKYVKFNLYFGQNLNSCVNDIKTKCYIDYIFSYSVVDMNVMSKMFGESLLTIETILEDYIYRDVIKAKIDAVNHTLRFVEGDERYLAYENAINAARKIINVTKEIVLRSDSMFDY